MEKKKNGWGPFIIILCVLIILGCIYIIYKQREEINRQKEEEGKTQNIEPVEEKKEEETEGALTEEQVNALYEQIKVFDHPLDDEFGYYYQVNDIKTKDFPNKVKLVLTYKNLIKNEDLTKSFSRTKQEVTNKMKEIFGPNIAYQDESFQINCQMVEFNVDKYNFRSESLGCGGDSRAIKTKLVSHKQENGTLILQEKYMAVNRIDDPEGRLDRQCFGIYKDFDDTNYLSYVCTSGGEELNIDINEYLDQLNTMEYIFVKDSDHYYFDQIRKIKG